MGSCAVRSTTRHATVLFAAVHECEQTKTSGHTPSLGDCVTDNCDSTTTNSKRACRAALSARVSLAADVIQPSMNAVATENASTGKIPATTASPTLITGVTQTPHAPALKCGDVNGMIILETRGATVTTPPLLLLRYAHPGIQLIQNAHKRQRHEVQVPRPLRRRLRAQARGAESNGTILHQAQSAAHNSIVPDEFVDRVAAAAVFDSEWSSIFS